MKFRIARTTLIKAAAIYILLIAAAALAFGIAAPKDFYSAEMGLWLYAAQTIKFVAQAVFAILAFGRLQDQNRPGWFAFATLAISLAAGFLNFPIVAVVAAVAWILLIIAMILPGTIGPNRYGPDPRGWTSQEHYDEQQPRLKSGE